MTDDDLVRTLRRAPLVELGPLSHDAADRIEKLAAALLLAAGLLSTTPEYASMHPEMVVRMLIAEAGSV